MNRVTCRDCHIIFDIDSTDNQGFIEMDGEYFCKDCAEDYIRCECCGDMIYKEDIVSKEEHHYCLTCFDEHFVICHDCGRYEHIDDAHYVAIYNEYVCMSCYCEDYAYCEMCDRVFPYDELEWDEEYECYYCRECYEENSPISSYHTHKNHHQPIFHSEYGVQNDDSKYLFLGAEIEVDDGDDREETAKEVITTMNNFIYCEHDGSLND